MSLTSIPFSIHLYRLHNDKYQPESGWLASSMASSDAYPSPPPSPPPGGAKVDPILRNALRYTISEKEYKTLHEYLITRSPPAVRKRAPQPPRYNAIVQSKDDYNAAAVRASLRLFVTSQAGLKIWDLFTTQILGRDRHLKFELLWRTVKP